MKIVDRVSVEKLLSGENQACPKAIVEAIEIAVNAEEGRAMVFKDHILEIQNTTRENYPSILNAFIADVNKSASMILRAIATLHENNLLANSPLVCGCAIEINDKNEIVNTDAMESFQRFFAEVKRNVDILNSYVEHRTWITGLTVDEVKKFKSIVKSRSEKLGSDSEIQAWCHPAFFSIDLLKGIKALKTIVSQDDTQAMETFEYFLNPEFDHPFNPLYYSCNLSDFKITPKKSVIYPIGETEFVALSAGGLKKGGKEVSSQWEPSFSIEFYIKKYLVEKTTKKSFKHFISAARDYLARDYFRLSQDRNWHENHPFVVQSRVVLDFELQLEQIKEGYEASVGVLRKFVGNGIFIDTDQMQHEIRSLGFKEPALSGGDSLTVDECFEHINDWAGKKISQLVDDFSANEKFSIAKTEEMYIQEAITSILDVCYQEHDIRIGSTSLQSFRDRATFHTTMLDSLVFDFRWGAAVTYSQGAQDAITSNLIDANLLGVMEHHPYHDFYEFDADFLSESSSISPKTLLSFLLLSRDLNIPIRHKCGFKLRKLGNYKAYGIYFSHTRMLGLDFRDGVESYIHEMAHHIDLSKSFHNRDNMVRTLYGYFKPIIKERIEYYLSSEELIARGAEVAVLLHASGYRKYHDLRQEPKKMISAMRSTFALSKESYIMRDWSVYRGSINHVNIELEITKKNFQLLDKIDEWYSSFWGWDLPSQKSVQRAESIGAGHYRESPYSKSHYSLNYYMAKAYSLSYGQYSSERYKEIASDFILTTPPPPNLKKASPVTLQDIEMSHPDIENVNRIKRLYGALSKFGDRNDFIAAIEPLTNNVMLDKGSLSVLRRDFDQKFSGDANYVTLLNNLEDVISIISSIQRRGKPL